MTTLDARGLACPLPLALARRRMDELHDGETLVVLATDPEAPIDLAAWAAEQGHRFRDLTPIGDPAWLTLEVRKRD